jgi:hypothetical protein
MRFLGQKPGSILFALPPKQRAWMGHISLPEPMDTFEIWPTPATPTHRVIRPLPVRPQAISLNSFRRSHLVILESPPFHHCLLPPKTPTL